MIYELTLDIADGLRRRKMPYKVIFGPERMRRELGNCAVIIERDSDVSDGVRGIQGSTPQARKRLVRDLAARARIYARSSLPGAHRGDHERLCEQLVDMLCVELDRWMIEGRTGQQLQVTEARYLKASEVNDPAEAAVAAASGKPFTESWPGVAYLLRFRVPRGMAELDFKGEARPTAVVSAAHGDVEIRLNGSTEPPEIVELPE